MVAEFFFRGLFSPWKKCDSGVSSPPAGDVLQVLESLRDRPPYIWLDTAGATGGCGVATGNNTATVCEERKRRLRVAVSLQR